MTIKFKINDVHFECDLVQDALEILGMINPTIKRTEFHPSVFVAGGMWYNRKAKKRKKILEKK